MPAVGKPEPSDVAAARQARPTATSTFCRSHVSLAVARVHSGRNQVDDLDRPVRAPTLRRHRARLRPLAASAVLTAYSAVGDGFRRMPTASRLFDELDPGLLDRPRHRRDVVGDRRPGPRFKIADGAKRHARALRQCGLRPPQPSARRAALLRRHARKVRNFSAAVHKNC